MQSQRHLLAAAIAGALSAPLAHAAATTVATRDTTTTIDVGQPGTFAGADFSYATQLYFAGPGTWSSLWTLESTQTGVSVAGIGGVSVTPSDVAAGATSTTIAATVPAGFGTGLFIAYSGASSATPGASFLTTTTALGHDALAFSGGGSNGVADGGSFDSIVQIQGDWAAPSSHSALTFGAGYTLTQDFVFNGIYTTVEVVTTDFQGVNPDIQFTLYGDALAVPEPGQWSLLALGALMLALQARRLSRRESD